VRCPLFRCMPDAYASSCAQLNQNTPVTSRTKNPYPRYELTDFNARRFPTWQKISLAVGIESHASPKVLRPINASLASSCMLTQWCNAKWQAAAAHVQIRPPKTALDARTCNHRSSLASNAVFWWGKSKKNSVVFGRIFGRRALKVIGADR